MGGLRVTPGPATLGTPQLGYPYVPIDEEARCAVQVKSMESLLAAGGSLDHLPFSPVTSSVACGRIGEGQFSDGVLCDDRTSLVYPFANISPTARYYYGNREFQHAANIGTWGGNVLCANVPNATSIVNPLLTSPMFAKLVEFLNAL